MYRFDLSQHSQLIMKREALVEAPAEKAEAPEAKDAILGLNYLELIRKSAFS